MCVCVSRRASGSARQWVMVGRAMCVYVGGSCLCAWVRGLRTARGGRRLMVVRWWWVSEVVYEWHLTRCCVLVQGVGGGMYVHGGLVTLNDSTIVNCTGSASRQVRLGLWQ